MRIKQSEVPIEVRRIAAQHLESLRGSKIGYNIEDLYLGDVVCPMYRPDLEKPAYFEFEVHKATRTEVDNRLDLVPNVAKTNILGADGYKKIYNTPGFSIKHLDEKLQLQLSQSLQGFIVVSISDHDFPIAHWSLEHMPISHEIERHAKAHNKKIGRIYKCDALAYVGEDENGNEVAGVGQKPWAIKGLSENFDKYVGKINSSVPKNLSEINGKPIPDSLKMSSRPEALVKRGAQPPKIELTDSGTWASMKKNYSKNYGVMLDSLKNKAARVWELTKLIQIYGEGIEVGVPHYVAVLEKEFSVQVSGEASEYVKVRIVKRPGNTAAVEILCEKVFLDREANFSLNIFYGNKQSEKLDFFIIDRNTFSKNKTTLKEEA